MASDLSLRRVTPCLALQLRCHSGGNKWNVPIGITVAKTTRIGKLSARFMLELNIIPAIPPLIKEPLF